LAIFESPFVVENEPHGAVLPDDDELRADTLLRPRAPGFEHLLFIAYATLPP
jgi:hypothetical protein